MKSHDQLCKRRISFGAFKTHYRLISASQVGTGYCHLRALVGLGLGCRVKERDKREWEADGIKSQELLSVHNSCKVLCNALRTYAEQALLGLSACTLKVPTKDLQAQECMQIDR